MKKIALNTLSVAFLFLTITNGISQERISISKKDFKVHETGFGLAWKSLNKGSFLFKQHREGSYRKAIPLLQEALNYNAENAEINLMMGICHLRSWPKEKALQYIQKAYDINSEVHPDIEFLLAKAYHSAGEFNKALISYNAYKDGLGAKLKPEIGEQINTYISQCENALLLKKNPVRALIDNFGQKINSEYDDYNPGFSGSNDFMAFTSRRPGKSDLTSPIDHMYYEDIFFSKKVGKDWDNAETAEAPLNSKWNDAMVSLSNDGQKMILYKGHTKRGDLYSATKKTGGWGYFQSVSGKMNNKSSHESFVCFNQTGTKMFFITDKEKNSYGGKDIYFSKLDEKGRKWSKPVNLGPNINSKYDEISVFINADETALYFSSNRPQSIGGFDIFKSVFKDDEWSEPVNIGMPINTPADDIFFNVMPNGRDAFYSSNNQASIGGFDIWSLILLGPEKPYVLAKDTEPLAGMLNPQFEVIVEQEVKIQYTRMTVVKGIVTDYNTGKPIEAMVELVDNATGKKEKESASDKNTGNYLITLPSGKNYGFSVNADGYMFHSENFNVPAASGYKEIVKDIRLQPMTEGSKIILFNTFFETGKSNLRVESYSELNRLAKMFEKYPNLVIEISGHTDSRGSVATNKKISNARAKAVADYLMGMGVKPSNIKAIGYHFLYPVASNKTEEGRQQNRRVEAKILKN